ncbi:MAG: hypothetical protein RSD82_06575, partial [Comamonas sp.]
MKKAFSIFAAALLVATGAMATNNHHDDDDNNPPPPTTGACVTCPEINVNAPLTQSTTITSSGVSNQAHNGATARQNIASNSGNVDINAATLQSASISSSGVTNEASDNANSMATQNIATNIGKVKV